MTRQDHIEIANIHRENSEKAIAIYNETHDPKYWVEYATEMKLVRKHRGIAQAMFTRKYGKI